MQLNRPLTVLIAPLDWGLGHATRCIPIIKELIKQGARIIVAASGRQKNLLKLEFPQLEFVEIPGYEITYKQGDLLKWALVLDIPSILKKIRKENQWLTRLVGTYKIDAVISDNRYGLYHKDLHSVFITHQLGIQAGFAQGKKNGSWQLAVGSWVERVLLKWNYRFIEKFSACWVPDEPGSISLGGKLSHPAKLPAVPTIYIGILSRFQFEERRAKNNSLLILISGPEPQRTLFENMLFEQLADCVVETVVVRGLPGCEENIYLHKGIRICNHLPASEMNALLNESEYIIARTGYSTIMDLIRVKKSAILVSTLGQTEQEYLGQYLNDKKWMYCVSEGHFNLNEVLGTFQQSRFTPPDLDNSLLSEVVSDLLQRVKR